MNKEKVMQVSVEDILAAKAPEKAKKIPGFVIRFLKKIIHQDEVNAGLAKYGSCNSVDFADNITRDTLGVTYSVHGLDNIDPSGRYIFASNHPLGGLDGMILIACIGKKFKDVRFIVNDLLMFLKPLAPIFIPVNKFGKMKHDNAKAYNDAFASDVQILYFPAGLCSRMNDGKIADPEWKNTFIKKAKEFDRDIVPVYFEGRNSNFFYRLAKIRKLFKIKFNIEMMFLPDEMFKQKGQRFDIYFGTPIPISSIDSSRSISDWTKTIREITYNLKPKK